MVNQHQLVENLKNDSEACVTNLYGFVVKFHQEVSLSLQRMIELHRAVLQLKQFLLRPRKNMWVAENSIIEQLQKMNSNFMYRYAYFDLTNGIESKFSKCHITSRKWSLSSTPATSRKSGLTYIQKCLLVLNVFAIISVLMFKQVIAFITETKNLLCRMINWQHTSLLF